MITSLVNLYQFKSLFNNGYNRSVLDFYFEEKIRDIELSDGAGSALEDSVHAKNGPIQCCRINSPIFAIASEAFGRKGAKP